jgi:hypothetical protein
MLPDAISAAAIFNLGSVVATSNSLALLEQHGVAPLTLLKRHAAGDWGNVPSDDAKATQDALKFGCRLLSSYRIAANATLWIITEADRSVTTLLLPSDY